MLSDLFYRIFGRRQNAPDIFLVVSVIILLSIIFWYKVISPSQIENQVMKKHQAAVRLFESQGDDAKRIKAQVDFMDIEERDRVQQGKQSTVTFINTIVTGFGTIMLVWATWRYVQLTQQLVNKNQGDGSS